MIFDGYLVFFAVWRKSSYPPISLLRTDSYRQGALNCTPALLLITMVTVVVSTVPACDGQVPSIHTPILCTPTSYHQFQRITIIEIPKDVAASPSRYIPYCLSEMNVLTEPLRSLLKCYIFSSYPIYTFLHFHLPEFFDPFLNTTLKQWGSSIRFSCPSFKEPSQECARIGCSGQGRWLSPSPGKVLPGK